jgi:hypothetical protein
MPWLLARLLETASKENIGSADLMTVTDETKTIESVIQSYLDGLHGATPTRLPSPFIRPVR